MMVELNVERPAHYGTGPCEGNWACVGVVEGEVRDC